MKKENNKIVRPWGGYTILKKTSKFWIKKLHINKNSRLSLQSHKDRNEVWIVESGTIIAQIGKQQHQAKAGDIFFVPKGKKHRLSATTKACVLEIAFGKTAETDILRYEDDYGRIRS